MLKTITLGSLIIFGGYQTKKSLDDLFLPKSIFFKPENKYLPSEYEVKKINMVQSDFKTTYEIINQKYDIERSLAFFNHKNEIYAVYYYNTSNLNLVIRDIKMKEAVYALGYSMLTLVSLKYMKMKFTSIPLRKVIMDSLTPKQLGHVEDIKKNLTEIKGLLKQIKELIW
jgi:hypothetical protein